MNMKTDKGKDWERLMAKKLHQIDLPLLISPSWLKRFGGGQVDVAVIKQDFVCHLYECKTNPFMSHQQGNRLRKSMAVVGLALKLPVKFFFIHPKFHSVKG